MKLHYPIPGTPANNSKRCSFLALLLTLLLLATTAAEHSTNRTGSSGHGTRCARTVFAHLRPSGAHIGARVIFASSLGAVNTLLRCCISNTLKQSAFANLTPNEIIDAALQFVDWFNAGNFGLV